MPAIIIFFKDEVIAALKLGLNDGFEDLVAVDLEGELTILRLRSIEIEVTLKIVPYSSLAVQLGILFLILLV